VLVEEIHAARDHARVFAKRPDNPQALVIVAAYEVAGAVTE
jgi:hypothetical protein